MTIVDALKELFVKFGGDETEFDAETVSQALDQISDVAESGGGGGYDAVIKATMSGGDITGLQLESGSYENLVTAIQSKKSVNIILYCMPNDTTIVSGHSFYGVYDTYVPEGVDPFFTFVFYWDNTWMNVYLHSDNTVEID